MIQKTIIATLLAFLSGTPLLRSQSIDTIHVDTLISITDSLISEVVKEIKKEIKDEAAEMKIDIKDGINDIHIEIVDRAPSTHHMLPIAATGAGRSDHTRVCIDLTRPHQDTIAQFGIVNNGYRIGFFGKYRTDRQNLGRQTRQSHYRQYQQQRNSFHILLKGKQ